MTSITEHVNPSTVDIDRRSTLEIVTLINKEDQTVAEAVAQVLPRIAEAIELIVGRIETGGRLFYIGTGTSGRLGVLDASECPPTFGVAPDLVQGLIAGGDDALRSAVEGAEDDRDQGVRDLEASGVSQRDAVVGISASGNTAYTLAALEHSNSIGAATIALTCNPESRMAAIANVSIAPVVGPEVIAGSSRMKAGTAQKMVLNMLSTGTMIRRGLVYRNLMSNLNAGNEKLRHRALAILASESGLAMGKAQKALDDAGGDLKVALVTAQSGLSREAAAALLLANGGSIRRAIDSLGLTSSL